MFVGKVQTITVLESCLSISNANEWLTIVHMKQNQEAQR